MRVGTLEQRVVRIFNETRLALIDRYNPPSITDLSRSHSDWIHARPALELTRTTAGNMKNILAEIVEATEELWAEGEHPTRRQRHNCAEEIGDAAIYTISALNHLGVTPEDIGGELAPTLKRIHQRFATRPVIDKLQHTPPNESIRHLQRMASFAQEIITTGQNPLDDQITYDRLVQSSLFGVLEAALEAGYHVTPHFETVISAKLRKNEERFPKRRFRMREGDDPEIVNAIGYAASKVAEKRWELHESPEELLNRNITVINRLGQDELLQRIQEAI